MRHLQQEEMTGHREVAAGVFETNYGDGSRTVVNYNGTPVDAAGCTVPALGYVLVGPKGEKTAFAFDEKDGLVRIQERRR